MLDWNGYLENLRLSIQELKLTIARLEVEREHFGALFGGLISEYEQRWERVYSAGGSVEAIENERVRAGRPRRMSLSGECRNSQGRRLLIPFSPEANRWEPEGYTPESTLIRHQIIEDFQHLLLQWSRYRSAKRTIVDLEEEQLRHASEILEIEELLLLYIELRREK